MNANRYTWRGHLKRFARSLRRPVLVPDPDRSCKRLTPPERTYSARVRA